MRAIVLAAGYATRLYPLTRECAKPLLEVGGQPLLSHLVDRIVALEGLEEIVVVTNSRFHHEFERWQASLDVSVAVRLLDDGSTSEADKLGAIGDLAFALEHTRDDHRP